METFVMLVVGAIVTTDALTWTGVLFENKFGSDVGSILPANWSSELPSTGRCATECQDSPLCEGFTARGQADGKVRCDFVQVQHGIADVAAVPGAAYFEKTTETHYNSPTPCDCKDVLNLGMTSSGVYDVSLNMTSSPMMKQVYCDMETAGGGWNVLLRRQDGSLDFDRNWTDYREGFGDLLGEFWAGNKMMNVMTSDVDYVLRVDLESFAGEYRFAEYTNFRVESQTQNYRLHLGTYSGNATDAFSTHDNFEFTTFDRDNDIANYNCADRYHGGWWYFDCSDTRLTGLYGQVVADDVEGSWLSQKTYMQGIMWQTWLGNDMHPSFVEMKIRPM